MNPDRIVWSICSGCGEVCRTEGRYILAQKPHNYYWGSLAKCTGIFIHMKEWKGDVL